MSALLTINDEWLAERIDRAKHRLVFVSPGVFEPVAAALVRRFADLGMLSMTLILDVSEDVCRQGYGDLPGLTSLTEAAARSQQPIRHHDGLRIGILIADEEVAVYSPIARMVDSPGGVDDRPNGMLVTAASVAAIERATGADGSEVLPSHAEIGKQPAQQDQIRAVIEKLEKNPPVPVALARVTRVFSTKFQFVELELRGGDWVSKEIRIDTSLLNADAPEELRAALETRVKAFASLADLEVLVPTIGLSEDGFEIGYRKGSDEPIRRPMKQADITKLWQELRQHYLRNIPGYGWLVSLSHKAEFEKSVAAFELMLAAWVEGFLVEAGKRREAIAAELTSLINRRVSVRQARDPNGLTSEQVRRLVDDALLRMKTRKAEAKIIYKNLSWDSTKDAEFIEKLKATIPAEELKDWFTQFDAVQAAPSEG